MEALEGRTLLATMVWNSASGGDWNTASNWVDQANPADQHVPTSADDALVNQAGITVTHAQSSKDSVNSVMVSSSRGAALGTRNAAPMTVLTSGQSRTIPAVTYAVADVRVVENQGWAEVTVVRSGDIDVVVSVLLYNTLDVTATAGLDYEPTAGQLLFGPHDSVKTFQVPLKDNAAFEGDESFEVVFYTPKLRELFELIERARMTVTIQEDDANPVPPLVQVVAGRFAMKKKAVTGIVLEVNGGLDGIRAGSLANYRLVTAGRDKKFATRDDKVVRLRGAAYDGASKLITLTASGRSLPLGTAMRLTVKCSITGLLDLRGRPIDGDSDGLPGGDYVASVTRKTVTALGVRLAMK
jgi:hypothetical protein